MDLDMTFSMFQESLNGWLHVIYVQLLLLAVWALLTITVTWTDNHATSQNVVVTTIKQHQAKQSVLQSVALCNNISESLAIMLG